MRLVLSGILAIDAAVTRLGRRMAWERSVTWVGAVGSVAVSLMFSAVLLPGYGQSSRDTARHFEELGTRAPDTSALFRLTGWQATRTIDHAIDDVIDIERRRPRRDNSANAA